MEQDIEFTVENGKVYILQTRTGKRTARAAVHIAVEMVGERMITEREALLRIDPHQMDFFMHPMVAPGFGEGIFRDVTTFGVRVSACACAYACLVLCSKPTRRLHDEAVS